MSCATTTTTTTVATTTATTTTTTATTTTTTTTTTATTTTTTTTTATTTTTTSTTRLFMPTGGPMKNVQSSGQLPASMNMNQTTEDLEAAARRSRGNYKVNPLRSRVGVEG